MGLRELKKTRLRQAVVREAMRLFAEQGYEGTTVEQIAEAAEISTTTFYRYYSSKEDVVFQGSEPLSTEPDSGSASGLAVRPAGEPLVDSLRAVIRDTFGVFATGDSAQTPERLARLRLIFQVPELSGRLVSNQQQALEVLAKTFAGRTGADPESLAVRMAAGATVAAVLETVRYWARAGGTEDLAGLLDETLTKLEPLLDLARPS